jgi:membrane fusion protein (multidrug efflux system)
MGYMHRSINKQSIIITVVCGLALTFGIYLWVERNVESTDDASIEADVVSISPKLSGYIQSVKVDDNQLVKKGDILIIIDPRDYKNASDQAKANYLLAKAAFDSSIQSLESTQVTAPSNLDSAQAQVEAAKSKWIKASADLQRISGLDDRVRTKQQMDEVISAERTAKSDLDDTLAKLKSAQTAPKTVEIAEAKVREAQAALEKAGADLAQAELDMENTKLVAPFDGKITQNNAEVGQFVQPGQKIFALVNQDFWVIANFKETQLTKMRPGQKAKIVIDAFPDKSYRGKVDSIQSGTGSYYSLFPPENATGNFVKVVQRVPVKITFEEKPDPAFAIGPGMSVVPTVYTK